MCKPGDFSFSVLYILEWRKERDLVNFSAPAFPTSESLCGLHSEERLWKGTINYFLRARGDFPLRLIWQHVHIWGLFNLRSQICFVFVYVGFCGGALQHLESKRLMGAACNCEDNRCTLVQSSYFKLTSFSSLQMVRTVLNAQTKERIAASEINCRQVLLFLFIAFFFQFPNDERRLSNISWLCFVWFQFGFLSFWIDHT